MKKIIIFSLVLMVLVAIMHAIPAKADGRQHGHRYYVKHSKHHKVNKAHRPHRMLDETYR